MLPSGNLDQEGEDEGEEGAGDAASATAAPPEDVVMASARPKTGRNQQQERGSQNLCIVNVVS